MLKSFKYQLNPDEFQREQLNKTFGCVRYIFNWGLNLKSKTYQETGMNVSNGDLSALVTRMKKQEETKWLKEVDSTALQQTLRNLEVAYTNFFKKRADFPKFKKKSRNQSFKCVSSSLKVEDNKIFLPKLKWVEFFKSRELIGTLQSCTVSKTPTGKYFVSILCETHSEPPKKAKVDINTAVGLDLGIKEFAVSSDGEVFENQRHLLKNAKRLRLEQRSLARKYQKGKRVDEQSNRWHEQRLLVAKLQERTANQRKDYLQKLSTKLVRQYDNICIEDLNVSGMIKNRKLSKHIADVGFRSFRTMLEYKCEWYGKNLFVIDRWTPSSKRCSKCGEVRDTLKLSERTFRCYSCGHKEDRDLNASRNIKILGLGTQPALAKTNH
jgi:putative transposase